MPTHKNPLLVHNFKEDPDPNGGKLLRYGIRTVPMARATGHLT